MIIPVFSKSPGVPGVNLTVPQLVTELLRFGSAGVQERKSELAAVGSVVVQVGLVVQHRQLASGKQCAVTDGQSFPESCTKDLLGA